MCLSTQGLRGCYCRLLCAQRGVCGEQYAGGPPGDWAILQIAGPKLDPYLSPWCAKQLQVGHKKGKNLEVQAQEMTY